MIQPVGKPPAVSAWIPGENSEIGYHADLYSRSRIDLYMVIWGEEIGLFPRESGARKRFMLV